MAPCQGRDSAFSAGAGRVSVECLVVMSLALEQQGGASQHHEAHQHDVRQALGGHASVDLASPIVGEGSGLLSSKDGAFVTSRAGVVAINSSFCGKFAVQLDSDDR